MNGCHVTALKCRTEAFCKLLSCKKKLRDNFIKFFDAFDTRDFCLAENVGPAIRSIRGPVHGSEAQEKQNLAGWLVLSEDV